MNKFKLKKIIWTLLFASITYYITLPAINLHSFNFYIYVITIYIFYKLINIYDIINIKQKIFTAKKTKPTISKTTILIPIIFFLIIIINIIYSPLLNSKSYAKRIKVNDKEKFSENIKEVDFNLVPLLDKDSSEKLGDRVMGGLPDLVSQFNVSNLYTQINYNNEIIRVTPLEYASIIKYFTNHKEGIKGYITVNSVTGESKLVKLKKGMKYMPSALFNDKLYRKLRFKYPTQIFDQINFELDNEGNPYWVAPIVSYKGVEMRKDIIGVVLLDPITGQSKKYNKEDIPKWVDHVYSANLIIEQINDWGKYQKGFINSLLGQKKVVMATEGYNYMTMNDDVYLYTGITSVSSDESNLGFILCNMRTKETNYYQVVGAEEYSAMASAEGAVQQMKYTSTFPLLINLNNKPTYLMSLKDKAGLVKMYAFVDATDYQKVVVTDTSLGINTAAENYLKKVTSTYEEGTIKENQITIAWIDKAYITGETYYYIEDTNGQKYKTNIKINENKIPFLKQGDTANIKYTTQSDVINIINID